MVEKHTRSKHCLIARHFLLDVTATLLWYSQVSEFMIMTEGARNQEKKINTQAAFQFLQILQYWNHNILKKDHIYMDIYKREVSCIQGRTRFIWLAHSSD